MKKVKKLGIWMDHSSAHLMEFTTSSVKTSVIKSSFALHEKDQNSGKTEGLTLSRARHLQSEYFEKLGDAIKDYDAVILFGPTDAKVELFNIIKTDESFANIQIRIKQTGKMTENQQHAFVREHFLAR